MTFFIANTHRVFVVAALLASAVVLRADDFNQAGRREFVTLNLTSKTNSGCGPAKLDFVRVMPDGTVSEDGFRVPTGSALVVTDVDWIYSNGTPGLTKVLVLYVENINDSSKRHSAFESTIRLGIDGAGGATEHLTTGFAVSSEARVCVDVLPGPLGQPLRLSSVVLRGYLTAAK